MTIRQNLSVLSLALCAALPLTVAQTAVAQTTTAQQRAAITTFQVQPAERLRPGEVLAFTVNGTPGSKASVQIAGISTTTALVEMRPGVYTGEYTIRQRDRLTAGTVATARLLKNGRAATATLGDSLLAGGQLPARTEITEFAIDNPGRARPGDELNFTLRGTPRGQASVALQGVANRIVLNETSPGLYQGSYVLRRTDKLRGEPVAQAYLVSDRREATRRYLHDGGAVGNGRDARAPMACTNCGRIESVTQVEVDSGSKNIIGTVAGGVIGGVIGHQVGGGSGKDLATVIGAVGGAYAGNRIQNRAGKTNVHRVAVRMDGGELQNFDYADDPQVQPGTLVRVDDGVLVRR